MELRAGVRKKLRQVHDTCATIHRKIPEHIKIIETALFHSTAFDRTIILLHLVRLNGFRVDKQNVCASGDIYRIGTLVEIDLDGEVITARIIHRPGPDFLPAARPKDDPQTIFARECEPGDP